MEDRIGVCHQVMLEIIYSARFADDYAALRRELGGVHRLPNGTTEYERALEDFDRIAAITGQTVEWGGTEGTP